MRHLPKALLQKKLRADRRYAIVVSAVSEARMHALNAAFRGKDRATDVLSFSQLEGPDFPTVEYHIGEVVLCPAYARRQALRRKVSLQQELAELTIHGVLHLFGYDHETSEAEAKIMFALQAKILRKVSVPFRGSK